MTNTADAANGRPDSSATRDAFGWYASLAPSSLFTIKGHQYNMAHLHACRCRDVTN